MKFKFELNNISIEGLNIGDVKVESEFSINEMVAMRKEMEVIMANIPAYLDMLADGYRTVNAINKEIELEEELELKQLEERRLAEQRHRELMAKADRAIARSKELTAQLRARY